MLELCGVVVRVHSLADGTAFSVLSHTFSLSPHPPPPPPPPMPTTHAHHPCPRARTLSPTSCPTRLPPQLQAVVGGYNDDYIGELTAADRSTLLLLRAAGEATAVRHKEATAADPHRPSVLLTQYDPGTYFGDMDRFNSRTFDRVIGRVMFETSGSCRPAPPHLLRATMSCSRQPALWCAWECKMVRMSRSCCGR